MTGPELPYDLPEGWPGRAAFPFWAVALGILALFYLVRAALHPDLPLEWFFAASFGALSLGAFQLWRATGPARRGIRLEEHADYTLGSPQPEDAVHVWDFRAFQWLPLLTVGVILAVIAAVAALLLSLGVFSRSNPADLTFLVASLGTTVIAALYFLFFAGWGIRYEAKRGGLGQREQVLISRYGISYRIQGLDMDVPWDEITAINADLHNTARRGVPRLVPFLTIDSGLVDQGFPVQVVGASPVQVLTISRFYWMNPAARTELGTAEGQQRMDDWLATLRSAR